MGVRRGACVATNGETKVSFCQKPTEMIMQVDLWIREDPINAMQTYQLSMQVPRAPCRLNWPRCCQKSVASTEAYPPVSKPKAACAS